MVPVRLELQNFLSYGTDAPPLDFETFEVACLSGGNGEGKSALLDAMTWAVWGEARKSSGKRKPDDELIRIGTRHMEVTFTFDLEGTRYRVTRSFSKSATGKTTSSGLEFQVYAPDEDAYRPLTGATQRETQARIDDTLGLDYDTFINSAFLLQGRSDEFTQKSPSQRKEILVRVLNLSRYERLEDRARDRWREEKERQRRAEAEIERLQEALADVSAWREERDELRDTLEARKEALAKHRETEKHLAQRRANLEAKAREAESVEKEMASIDERIEAHRNEVDELDEQIEEADALLETADEIRAKHEQYESLREEREALEDERDRHRRLERALEEKKSALRNRINEAERRLDRLTAERDGLQNQVQDLADRLADRPQIEQALRAAQAARQRLRELEGKRARRTALQKRQEEARRVLVGRREELRGELTRLREQMEEERAALERKEDAEQRVDRLKARKERRDALDEQLTRLEREGKTVSQHIQEATGQVEALEDERERRAAELDRLRAADGPQCPTCGTELTDAHRQEVVGTLKEEVQELEAAIQARTDRLSQKKDQRRDLRERYVALREERQELDGVSETLATVQEQLRVLEETAEAFETHSEQAEALQHRLETGSYAEDARRRWQWCAQRRAELTVDADRLGALQEQAAQVDRYVEALEELRTAADRREALEQKIERHEEKIDDLRATLDNEDAFDTLQSTIQDLKEQLRDTAFDPDRFQSVRTRLRELSDVPDRLSELQRAEEKRADWVRKRQRLAASIEDLEEEREQKRDRHDALTEALEDKATLNERLASTQESIRAAESEIEEHQQRLGMLNERLERAKRNREALEEAKQERDDARHQRHLYDHLRTAFGTHGIPSLIIEETLPEIEERANRILDRLTDGRMHVRLETLKEKKRGGTKETLEIIITDEQGVPRPYETFSGGESFRINFALRVALAQLLAERSGVRVRTLVIDEGFGTQDEEGIQRLVEAIQAVRDDFAKVLVITHLERLKQAFPVRIEVEKDPALGSTFELVRG